MGIVLGVVEGAARGGVMGIPVAAAAGYLMGVPIGEATLAGAVGGAIGGVMVHASQDGAIHNAAVVAARAHA